MTGFERLDLSPNVGRALKEMGFEKPTDIQAEAMPFVFQQEDIIGQAKTGTGKTAVFGIYFAQTLDEKSRDTQAIVLAPTRELAVQISDEINRIAKYTGISAYPIYGGKSIRPQIERIKKGVQVLVCTPGRLLDHIDRGTVHLLNVKCLVIDEADRMLDMGFIDDVKKIISYIPEDKQTLLFSATMPREILELSKKYQKQPQFISVSRDEVTIKHIEHVFIQIDYRDRYRALYSYLKQARPPHAIVFCKTKSTVNRLSNEVRNWGFKAEGLHGDMSQAKRDRAMWNFRSGKINVLIATDLAARGLDISNITHVINFNLPDRHVTYTHRVGRTGRAGKGGTSVSLVASDEMGMLGDIERACNLTMTEKKIKLDMTMPKSRFKSKRPHVGGRSYVKAGRKSYSGKRSYSEKKQYPRRRGSYRVD